MREVVIPEGARRLHVTGEERSQLVLEVRRRLSGRARVEELERQVRALRVFSWLLLIFCLALTLAVGAVADGLLRVVAGR